MIPFAVGSVVLVASSVMAVRTPDLVRGVLWLGLALVATAGLYATMDAGFMAAIQVLLYTGGVVTLMLFAVMLARPEAEAAPNGEVRAGIAVAAIFAAVVSAILRSPDLSEGAHVETQVLGAVILNELALPFEVLSVLLLVAMVGAIVLARKKDE